jgi:uncharacterized protein (DUF1684 family)
VDWRRRVSELYANVRAEPDPRRGHELWRAGRDDLLINHPQSPLPADHTLRRTGVAYWPYAPELRFQLPLRASPAARRAIETGGGETTVLRAIGTVVVPPPLNGVLTAWWLNQYGGGLFLPVRDGTAGTASYGGGRYLLDTAKGADLGGTLDALVIDFNFLYHPSCRYSSDWQCPLAPAQNMLARAVCAGERFT